MKPASGLFATICCPDPMPNRAWVYILQTGDRSLYIGQTNNLPERLRKHRLGLGSKHTHDHGQPRLVYWEGPISPIEAVRRESQLKRWSRAKKDALICGDHRTLKVLSRSRAEQPARTLASAAQSKGLRLRARASPHFFKRERRFQSSALISADTFRSCRNVLAMPRPVASSRIITLHSALK